MVSIKDTSIKNNTYCAFIINKDLSVFINVLDNICIVKVTYSESFGEGSLVWFLATDEQAVMLALTSPIKFSQMLDVYIIDDNI